MGVEQPQIPGLERLPEFIWVYLAAPLGGFGEVGNRVLAKLRR